MSVICIIQSLSSFEPRLSVNLPSGFSTMKARVYLEKPVPAWRLISRGRQTRSSSNIPIARHRRQFAFAFPRADPQKMRLAFHTRGVKLWQDRKHPNGKTGTALWFRKTNYCDGAGFRDLIKIGKQLDLIMVRAEGSWQRRNPCLIRKSGPSGNTRLKFMRKIDIFLRSQRFLNLPGLRVAFAFCYREPQRENKS
jgi:hypothetical protein